MAKHLTSFETEARGNSEIEMLLKCLYTMLTIGILKSSGHCSIILQGKCFSYLRQNITVSIAIA